ncbi:lasso peptide biosynthesis B2 protein [Peribacillus kribbensis]|uniref:lasso peptide biosynthesis B2 protein n=1 Tax=Peribacillus kribbensis TaxID=356658 RepID=UPI00047A3C95|nr:lasso peptide biosynthesis B2 protein [Peribacillus kribbensis]
MRKLKTFIFLDIETKWLLIESFIFLGWARFLKMLPFSKVAPALGIQMVETSFSDHSNNKCLKKVSSAIHIMSSYTFWESKCLVKAVAAMKMLERRKIESTLYFGTAKDDTGQMIAHAWLRSGSIYVTGSEGMEQFTVVSHFAKKITDNRGI